MRHNCCTWPKRITARAAKRSHSLPWPGNKFQSKIKMNSILNKFPALCRFVGMLFVAAFLWSIGLVHSAIALVIMFQLCELASSKQVAACFLTALSQKQMEEFEEILREIGGGWEEIKKLPEQLLVEKKRNDELAGEVKKLRRGMAGGIGNSGVRWVGNIPFVTDDCAEYITATFIMGVNELKGDALASLCPDSGNRERILSKSKSILGMQAKTALTGTEIPLPTIYAPQIIELVFAFGCARQYATVFPLGAGTVKLPRLKAGEDDFAYLGVGTAGNSQAVPEKRVTAELVTFTANKLGGLIRIPSEIESDTFVQLGQFLARYIARQLAKMEDKTLFLADGTATYASQTGVGPYCVANAAYLLQLGAGKTKLSDVTLDDLRALRGKVSPAVLANMAANGQTDAAYYFHPSMEPLLRSFNKYPNFIVFTNENGKPMFDGWPIRWIGVGATNDGTAQASAFAAFFGALSYWFLGERGAPRVEVSKEVFFATDELAMRALERIDVEALAVDAMATLQLAAS